MHRDVKPENILLGRNSEVLLSGFGLAIGTYSSSQDGVHDASGTIAYMVPEQSRGKPRPASDQYALAIAVYEWLCGARPFDGTHAEVATPWPGCPTANTWPPPMAMAWYKCGR